MKTTQKNVLTRCLGVAVIAVCLTMVAAEAYAVPEGQTCTIEFVDGKELKIEISRETTGLKQKITQIGEANKLVLELDGKTVIIPLANVRMITFDPSLDTRPYYFMKGKVVK